MSLKRLLAVASWALYPFVILFGLRVAGPRAVAFVLLALLLLRRGRQAAHLLTSLSAIERMVLAGLLLLAGAAALGDSEFLLRLYPGAVNLGMLTLFAGSLLRPPTMVERFARLSEVPLSAAAVAYTRRVTQIWCAFFAANGACALYTALCASRDDWALYNGGVAYLLMGVLFAGEWLFRRYVVIGRAP